MLSSEIERLQEIYSLLFPRTRVGIVVELVPPHALQEAVEISTESAATLLSTGNSRTRYFEINEALAETAEHYFLVKCCLDPANAYAGKHARMPKGWHWKVIFWWRRTLMYRYPYLYERVKHTYLKFFDRKTVRFDRLLNLRNPKNTVPAHVSQTHNNVLIGLHWLDVGGAESFAVESAELAHRMGKNVFVIASHIARPFYLSRLEALGKVFELDRQIPRRFRLLFINALVKRFNISLVHNHHSVHVYESLPLLRLNHPGLQVVDSIHIDEKNRFLGGFPRLSIVWSNYIDVHHTISQRLQRLLTHHGIHSGHVRHGHLGKHLQRQDEFSILKANKSLRLCFVGRMSGQKRPLLAFKLLVWAIKYGKQNGINVKVDVVGDGFYLEAFSRAVAISGVSTDFQLHPANADVKALMREVDVLLLTSENEGITLVGYEAYACGALVVSTDVGAQDELVPEALLLPESPSGAYRRWRQLFPKIVKDPSFVKACIEDFHRKVAVIDQSGSAEQLFRTIYGSSQ